jgi:ABC-type dipeptide/oligopeptide/nickel transport system permease component
MREYVLRRLVSMVPVLFIVSVISFGLLYVLPSLVSHCRSRSA